MMPLHGLVQTKESQLKAGQAGLKAAAKKRLARITGRLSHRRLPVAGWDLKTMLEVFPKVRNAGPGIKESTIRI